MYYEKVFIKSEDDLPKKSGFYFAHWKYPDERIHSQMTVQYYDESNKELWFKNDWYDWYLQPIKQPELKMPTKQEISRILWKQAYYDDESSTWTFTDKQLDKAIDEILKRNK